MDSQRAASASGAGDINYIYDDLGRLVAVVNPSSETAVYTDDANGNILSIDRRPSTAVSVIEFTPNKATITIYGTGFGVGAGQNAAGGLSTLTYDDLGRLTREISPRGTVSYAYDKLGRRTSMSVTGQTNPVTYEYDNANRLKFIRQGTTVTVGYTYDSAHRPDTLTLPNGIVLDYAYDAASRLTGITYKQGVTTIGDLTYGYDAAGQRTSMGGSEARTGLPQEVTGRTYNAANQLVATGFTYDDAGNLTSDGVYTYSWDARGQLSEMKQDSTSVASYGYDGFGRRRSTVINGVGRNYVYDGANTVQELSGTTPSVNLLTGLGVDQVYARTEGATTNSFVTDGLGSTLALADASGTFATEYTYDPFGNTTVTGAASTNKSQFTGRENDGTGLHYNRARYYSPSLGRFISEDPIGFGGGDVNLYAYVGNGPTNWTDPSGTCASDSGSGGNDLCAALSGGVKIPDGINVGANADKAAQHAFLHWSIEGVMDFGNSSIPLRDEYRTNP